jgi:hypothetical protein
MQAQACKCASAQVCTCARVEMCVTDPRLSRTESRFTSGVFSSLGSPPSLPPPLPLPHHWRLPLPLPDLLVLHAGTVTTAWSRIRGIITIEVQSAPLGISRWSCSTATTSRYLPHARSTCMVRGVHGAVACGASVVRVVWYVCCVWQVLSLLLLPYCYCIVIDIVARECWRLLLILLLVSVGGWH